MNQDEAHEMKQSVYRQFGLECQKRLDEFKAFNAGKEPKDWRIPGYDEFGNYSYVQSPRADQEKPL